ncbi:hypothetical protein DPMN_000334 [Dreissena polymorpha]|uniref:Uncharacterized protein n=1 Tax=Dreissena polymorpha TaxID=45954 RepID=A0A9D4MHY4_DREPO|nr:hypothetical protein DPMN_000334 [Dreissena polymorpha]
MDGSWLLTLSNNKIKLLNQLYQVVSHMGMTCQQYMCQITPTEVAVTVNDDNSNTHNVQFITITQNQLIPARKLQLQHACLGIAHHQGDLFIASGTALYKYSISGKQVCRLYKDAPGGATGKY